MTTISKLDLTLDIRRLAQDAMLFEEVKRLLCARAKWRVLHIRELSDGWEAGWVNTRGFHGQVTGVTFGQMFDEVLSSWLEDIGR